MRKLNVVTKLWLAFTTLILVVMIPLEMALDRLLTDFYASQVTEPLLYHSEQLAHMLADDPAAVLLAPMMGRMVGGEVILLDSSGESSLFPGSSSAPPPAEAVRTAQSGIAFAGQVLGAGQVSLIVTAVPIPKHGGAVVLLAPAAPVQYSLQAARQYLIVAGVGTLLLGTGLALMLARSLLRPVIAIEQATAQIAGGDFSTRVPVSTTDEIGQLALAVNQMTARLEHYDQQRREFLANVAHELRTPLAYIRGYTQAMTEGLVVGEEQQNRHLRIVQEEAIRLSRLVDDLMDLAQMEEGHPALNLQPLDLFLPMEQALAALRPRAESKGVHLTLSIPEDLPHPLGDERRIQQVVVNLLDNGLRHTPPGGSVDLSAKADAKWITVRVTDTGSGIEPEHLPLIFERFHKHHQEGRGLGLAIVRSIVRAHKGDIGVESKRGEGSSFWFRLPRDHGFI